MSALGTAGRNGCGHRRRLDAQDGGARWANSEPHQAQGHRNQERASRAYPTSKLAVSSEPLITANRQELPNSYYQSNAAAGHQHPYQTTPASKPAQATKPDPAAAGSSPATARGEQHRCKPALESKSPL
jgi:hypothetical protein